mgnify:CR=1 FL=1
MARARAISAPDTTQSNAVFFDLIIPNIFLDQERLVIINIMLAKTMVAKAKVLASSSPFFKYKAMVNTANTTANMLRP